MSFDSVYVGARVKNLLASPKSAAYTGVIINTSDNTFVSAGDITGENVLEVSSPWATTADAQRILNILQGFEYQPYEATGAFVDPAAEIGDAVTINRVYGGIYTQDITFSNLYASDISAPQEEQIDNEYKYVSSDKREYKRELADVRATLELTASQITAQVSNKLDSSGGSHSFSWELTATGFVLKSNGATVFKADQSGITVTGDGTFTGNVYASNIQYGGDYGTFNGAGITGGTVGTGQTSSYINGGIADAYFSGDVFSGAATADWMIANTIKAPQSGLYWNNRLVYRHQVTLHEGDKLWSLDVLDG